MTICVWSPGGRGVGSGEVNVRVIHLLMACNSMRLDVITIEIEKVERRGLGHATFGSLEERKEQLRCHIVRTGHTYEHV